MSQLNTERAEAYVENAKEHINIMLRFLRESADRDLTKDKNDMRNRMDDYCAEICFVEGGQSFLPLGDMLSIRRSHAYNKKEGNPTNPYASAVMKSDVFKRWMTTPKSSALLVNGNFSVADDSWNVNQVPHSWLCAELIYDLDSKVNRPSMKANETVCFYVAWFCNLPHRFRYDPSLIMVSFVAQLLVELVERTSKIPGSRVELEDIPDLDSSFRFGQVEEWHRLFLKLLENLPSQAMVFCLIDDITCSVERDQGETLDTILANMLGLVRNPENDLVFKLFVTAPLRRSRSRDNPPKRSRSKANPLKRSRSSDNPFEDVETLDLHETEMSDLTNQSWASDIGEYLDKLGTVSVEESKSAKRRMAGPRLPSIPPWRIPFVDLPFSRQDATNRKLAALYSALAPVACEKDSGVDVCALMRSANNLTPAAQERARAFMNSKQLGSLMQHPYGLPSLFVSSFDTCCHDPEQQVQELVDDGSFSWVCAKVVHDLYRELLFGPFLPICWFCGSNAGEKPRNNLDEMMANMIRQLLEEMRKFATQLQLSEDRIPSFQLPDTSHREPNALSEQLKSVFNALVELFKDTDLTILCIIDGLSHYEQAHGDALWAMVRYLKSTSQSGIHFKLLATAHKGFATLKKKTNLYDHELTIPEAGLDLQWAQGEGIGNKVQRLKRELQLKRELKALRRESEDGLAQ